MGVVGGPAGWRAGPLAGHGADPLAGWMPARRRLGALGVVLVALLAWQLLQRRSGGARVPRVVFSDVDGTLAHYAWQLEGIVDVLPRGKAGAGVATLRYRETDEEVECVVLPSRKSGAAYVSRRTIELVAQLRARGVAFVMISGARSSTYLGRRPLLPEADFDVFENGGRILERNSADPAWSQRMRAATGFDAERPAAPQPAVEARPEPLWAEYRELEREGWQLDATDYFTEFRVSAPRHGASGLGFNLSRFEAEVAPRLAGRGLARNGNLGKLDIFPAISGKANAARHILGLLGAEPADAVALFDDDNDLELGELCGRSFLPGVTSDSVRQRLAQRPAWKVMPARGPLATEQALEAVLALVVGQP